MQTKKLFEIFKVCDQQRFHLVSLRMIFQSQKQHAIQPYFFHMDICNVSYGLFLRHIILPGELIAPVCKTTNIFRHAGWWLYFVLKAISLGSSSFEFNLSIKIYNQILLFLDISGAENTSEFYNIFIYAIANFVYEDFFNNLQEYKFGAALCCYLFMFNEKVRVHQLLNNSKFIFFSDLFWIFALPLSLSYFSEFKKNWQFSVGWILLEALFSAYELYIYFQADNPIKQNQIASPGPAAEISKGNKNKDPERFYEL